MIRPVELALGEPHVDTRSGPPPGLLSGDAFLFAEKWAAAADALARDPVLALAPLRALRDRRFVRPRQRRVWRRRPLFAALDASRSCAAASPTLAGELWGTPRVLAAWARWHAPRASFRRRAGRRRRRRRRRPAAVARRRRRRRRAPLLPSASTSRAVRSGRCPRFAWRASPRRRRRPERARARLASALETLGRLAPENASVGGGRARRARSRTRAPPPRRHTRRHTPRCLWTRTVTIDDRSTRHRSRAFSSRSGGTTDFLAAETRKTSRSAPVYSSRARRTRRRGFPSRESPRFSRGTRGTFSCVPNVFSTKTSRVGAFYSTQRFPDSPTAIRARRSSPRGRCWRAAVRFRMGRRRRRLFMDISRRTRPRSTRSASPRRTRRSGGGGGGGIGGARGGQRARRPRRRQRGVAAFPSSVSRISNHDISRTKKKGATVADRSSPRGPRSPPAR